MDRQNGSLVKTLDYYTTCDILLLKMYLKFDVIMGFPDVPDDVVVELESHGLLIRKESHCYITLNGIKCVHAGGIKKFLESQQGFPEPLIKLKNFGLLFHFPFLAGIVVFFFIFLLVFLWIYFSLNY